MSQNKDKDKEQKICHETKRKTKNKIYAIKQRQSQSTKDMP